MKRTISFFLAVFILIGLLPVFAVNANAATQLSYSPNANIEYKEKSSVKCGTIRYVSQITSSSYFFDSYWGSKWKKQAGTECGTSCISMALSYVGVNKTPKAILDAGKGETVFAKTWGSAKYKGYNYTDLDTAMDKYINGKGKYSPPVIHLRKYSNAGHWVLLVGRVSSDTYRVLDPASNELWNITINGKKATYKKPGSSKTISDTITVGNGYDVRQWYNSKAKITAQIITQPKSVAAFEGETAEVSIKASGNGLTYKWYYKNSGSSKFSVSKSCTGNTYSTTMDAKSKGRQVYCVIKDQYGNTKTSKTVTLSLAKQAKITTQPTPVVTILGEKAKTTIKATGDGLTYQWYYKDPGKSSYTKSSLTGTTYSVTMTKKNNGRLIYCTVTDDYGTSVKSDTVKLSITDLVEERLPTYCKIKAKSKTSAMSLPCSKSTDPNSKSLESVAKGDTYTANALVRNSEGNYWYRVTTSKKKVAYVPASKMTFSKVLTSDIKISDVKAPKKLKVGKSYSIDGTIDASYSNVTKIAAYVYRGEKTSGDAVTGGAATVNKLPCSLSAVDSKVLFNKLSKGTYTFAVFAYYDDYYAKDEKTSTSKTGKVCIYKKTFTVTK